MKNRKYKERTGWECPTWRLRVIDFPSADGSIKERGVIDHPGSVVIVPLMGEEVMILNQHRIALDTTILELPAGTRDLGEEWLVTAQRELREETGYEGAPPVLLGAVEPNPAILTNRCHLYLIRDCVRVADQRLDPGEDIEVTTLPRSEIDSAVADGRISHALVVCAFWWLKQSGTR